MGIPWSLASQWVPIARAVLSNEYSLSVSGTVLVVAVTNAVLLLLATGAVRREFDCHKCGERSSNGPRAVPWLQRKNYRLRSEALIFFFFLVIWASHKK
jgi:hypothetical protein